MKLKTVAVIAANLLILAVAGRTPALAQDVEAPEYQVKAAFLYNFAKFAEWPTNTFASTNAPMTFGVFGPNPFRGELKRALQGRSINGHPLRFRELTATDELKQCQVVFISAKHREPLNEILNAVRTVPVLTVGEEPGHFIEAGGIINFILEDDKVHFEINNEAARRVGLKLSSKLLSLATRVKNGN